MEHSNDSGFRSWEAPLKIPPWWQMSCLLPSSSCWKSLWRESLRVPVILVGTIHLWLDTFFFPLFCPSSWWSPLKNASTSLPGSTHRTYSHASLQPSCGQSYCFLTASTSLVERQTGQACMLLSREIRIRNGASQQTAPRPSRSCWSGARAGLFSLRWVGTLRILTFYWFEKLAFIWTVLTTNMILDACLCSFSDLRFRKLDFFLVELLPG